jgi:ribonucleoside-diphosphate reductase alpha chain
LSTIEKKEHKEFLTNPVSINIWKDRYQKNNETINESLKRVAKFCANTSEEEEKFLKLMEKKQFFPAGRTMSNAGIGEILTLNNCFFLNSVPDSISGIFEYVKIGSMTQQAGGGTGYDFSLIRPSGTSTKNDAVASGVVSFMDVFNSATATILQGGRRGANLGSLSVYHPDIYEFLESKSWEAEKLTHFNLSVMIDDRFMNAVEADQNIHLHWPVYDECGHHITDPTKWKISKEIKARELFDKIMMKAYMTGEYGVFFYDNMNRDNNTYYIESIIGSNPCAEYLSGVLFEDIETPETKDIESVDYMGACNLGSINLHNFVKNPFKDNAYIAFSDLDFAVTSAVRFLDNIIDKNKFPYPAYENYQKNLRTIGLGITGLANMFTMMGCQYGDEKSVQIADMVMGEIAMCAYRASIRLAQEKGSFPFLNREKFARSNFIQKHIDKYQAEGQHVLAGEWKTIQKDIIRYGIRNARLISVAPTGTMSLVFGENCSSGIEPIFSLSQKRKIKMGGQNEEHVQIVDLHDYSYELFRKIQNSTHEVLKTTSDDFVTMKDLSVDDHLKILEAVAFHTDMAISKTVNVPTEYTFEQTKDVYMKVWKSGIKSCTIFRPNALRQGVFIQDEKKIDEKEAVVESETLPVWGTTIKASNNLIGKKRKVMSGCGGIHVQAYFEPDSGRLMEIYLSKGSQGTCNSFMVSNSRLISLALRTGASFESVIDQLKSTPSCPSYAVRSATKKDTSKGSCCPSGIANVLIEMHDEIMNELFGDKKNVSEEVRKTEVVIEQVKDFEEDQIEFLSKNGEIAFAKRYHKCPVCKEHLEDVSGCLTCLSCGFSKC